MMNLPAMKMVVPFVIVLTACGSATDLSGEKLASNIRGVNMIDPQQNQARANRSAGAVEKLPEKYLKAFTCNFDENPLIAAERYHGTPAGRAERARDLTLLRSLGFAREGRDGDLESAGGRIAAPPGVTILGLPVRFLELNGLIGDANAMYVTTFDKGVTVGQVVKAARLTLDRDGT